MTIPQAHNTHVGFALETVWGTFVPPTKFLELVSETIKPVHTSLFPDSARGVSHRRHFEGVRSVAGDFTVEVPFDGILRLMEAIFGADSVATATLGGAPPAEQHTITLKNAFPVGLSVEIDRDTISSRYAGCRVGSASFAMAVDKILQVTASIVGKDGPIAGPGAFVGPAENYVKHHQFVGEINDAGITVLGAALTINQNLGGSRPALGNIATLQPVRAGHREITGTLTLDVEDSTLMIKYLANPKTEFKLELGYTGAIISGANAYGFNFTMNRCVFLDFPFNVGAPGPLTVVAPFAAVFDVTGAKDAVELVITNVTTAIG